MLLQLKKEGAIKGTSWESGGSQHSKPSGKKAQGRLTGGAESPRCLDG